MKFLRVIRFDQSDDYVFALPAAAGEWALPGGFEFADITPELLTGKTRQAFANGFLGIASFGRATFTVVTEIGEEELEEIVSLLADRFLKSFGAPSMAAAREAARNEADFVLDLCTEKPVNTVFTVRRVLDDSGIHEEFRVVTPPSRPLHTRVWEVIEDDA